MMVVKTICFAFLLQNVHCYSIYSKLPEVYGENDHSHLNINRIKRICDEKCNLCKSNNTIVCAVRYVNQTMEYKDFENSCFLFLTNMCEYPGEEYNIVEGGTCQEYFRSRRHIMPLIPLRSGNMTEVQQNVTENETVANASTTLHPSDLRSGISRVYEIDTAFDYHNCPLSCPDTYSPVCVSANRGAGKYFKFYTFVNHCKGDLYYCKHFEEFGPPPDESEENVNSSPLSWSYCGAFRYMQFARFSEVLSSMGHYGWLAGNDRYSRIIPQNERNARVG